jgi:hypothetical protein
MTRGLKTLGFALTALLATGALLAAGAQAGFTASSYPVSISGSQTTTHKWTFQGSSVECKSASLSGSLAANSEQLALTPSYSECTAFGFLNATVTVNTCNYLSTHGSSVDGQHKWKGSTHIVCTKAGDTMTIVAASCAVHIPPQTPTIATVDYEEETFGQDEIVKTSTVSGIHADITSGFLCPLTEKSTDTTGTYSGSSTLTASGGASLDID